MGDVILTTPVIRALKKKFTNSKIDFLVKPQYLDVIRYNPNVNETFEFVVEKSNELLKQLKQNRYDAVVDLQNNFRSRKITYQLNSTVFRFKKLTLKKFLLVHFKMNLLKNSKTITERYAAAVPDLQLDDKGLEIFFPDKIQSKLDKKNEIIGFCPGSKHYTKRWLAEYFIELGKKLTAHKFTIALFGGRDDREICFNISKQIPNCINLQNEDDILETAANMKECKLIISNDSGLMHTASAVGVPVAALFGSSVKEFGFVPYGIKNLILENKSLSCRPCSHIGKENCPRKHFRCMKDLTPEFVYENILRFIDSL